MTKRPVRVVLLLLFLAAMGTTAYLFWIAERESRSTEAAARAFDDHARSAEGQVADLRSAQQAYVAAGQGPDFWFAKATRALDDLRSSITDLRATASAPATVAAFDDVLGSLQDFDQMDARARVYARGHQPSLASDLIFSNGVDLTRKISESVDQARLTERAARDAQIAALNRREVFSLGAAAAASLLIVLLLMPAGASREATISMPVESPAALLPRPVANPGLEAEGWSPAKRDKPVETNDEPVPEPAREPAAAPLTESAPAPASAAPAPVPVPVPPRIHLPQVASICADLARIVDTRTLPSLLERAADTLDAAGIVLWVADPDGRELAPTMAYGYAPTLVVRLGTIERDAENATAAAFRTSLIQTVTGDAVSNGAIAAPLVGAAGCVGVMAAEVRNRGERDDSVLAAAGIIAAQLATLVAPPSSRAKAEAAG
ncbi:MAG TPA: GAF domain-containing protein [Vicinamibacterales bacterium]|jgi:hypothetical protein|nr:GAF domain-containing protein [Vicinamibacterales bacterium]